MLKVHIENVVDKKKLKACAEETGRITAGQVAKEVYNLSQSNCPVSSGTLKRSGSIVPTPTGYEVKYDCAYALNVEKKPQSMLVSGKAHFLSSALADITKGGVQID